MRAIMAFLMVLAIFLSLVGFSTGGTKTLKLALVSRVRNSLTSGNSIVKSLLPPVNHLPGGHLRSVGSATRHKNDSQTSHNSTWMVTTNAAETVEKRFGALIMAGINTDFIITMIENYNASDGNQKMGRKHSLRAFLHIVDTLNKVFQNMNACFKLSDVISEPERDEAFRVYNKGRLVMNKRVMFYLCEIKDGSITVKDLDYYTDGIGKILDELDGYVPNCRTKFHQMELELEKYKYFGLIVYDRTFEDAFQIYRETKNTEHLSNTKKMIHFSHKNGQQRHRNNRLESKGDGQRRATGKNKLIRHTGHAAGKTPTSSKRNEAVGSDVLPEQKGVLLKEK